MAEVPELGQLLVDAPHGEVGSDEFVDALLGHALAELVRIYWNVHQKQLSFHEHVPRQRLGEIEFASYDWAREDGGPNFSWGGVQWWWYKYPGRGNSINVLWDAEQWRGWINAFVAYARDHERALFGGF